MSAPYDTVIKLLQQRTSSRSFSSKPLDRAVTDTLHEAFSLAPQAGGERHVACSFLTDTNAIRTLATAGADAFRRFCDGLNSPFIREEMLRYGENFFWFGNVPALAVVTCREEPAFLREALGIKAPALWGGAASASMAAFALLLAAESMGLGACCLTGPLAVWREMESRLSIPKRDNLVLLIALGFKKDA